jgi:hypothetical protein
MNGETFVLKNRRKFVTVLRACEWAEAAPSWLLGSYYVDIRGDGSEDRFSLLVDSLLRRLPEQPLVEAQGFKALPDKTILDDVGLADWRT